MLSKAGAASAEATRSLVAAGLPNFKRASRRASWCDIPEAMLSSTRMSICDVSSASISRSRLDRENKFHIRRKIDIRFLMRSARLREHPLPGAQNSSQLLAIVFCLHWSACNISPSVWSQSEPTAKRPSRSAPCGAAPGIRSPPPRVTTHRMLAGYAEQSHSRASPRFEQESLERADPGLPANHSSPIPVPLNNLVYGTLY